MGSWSSVVDIGQIFRERSIMLSMLDKETLTATGGFFAFCVALWQYRIAQRWKRREFIANEVKSFESDIQVKSVLMMLDWNDRPVPLKNLTGGQTEYRVVHDQLLVSALSSSSEGFSGVEASVRDAFDAFLDAFGRLQLFVEAGLIRQGELKPYLIYWIRTMSGVDERRHSSDFYAALHRYIKVYGFESVARLMSANGYSLDAKLNSSRDAILS